MHVQLSGRSAIVTGGAGGLGEAAVRALVEAGARVVVADLGDDRGKGLEGALGDKVRYVNTDVTQEESVKAALDVAAGLGTLRTAVVVPGGHVKAGRIAGRSGPLSLDGYRRTLEHCLTGTFKVMRLAAAAMAATDPDPEGRTWSPVAAWPGPATASAGLGSGDDRPAPGVARGVLREAPVGP